MYSLAAREICSGRPIYCTNKNLKDMGLIGASIVTCVNYMVGFKVAIQFIFHYYEKCIFVLTKFSKIKHLSLFPKYFRKTH